MKQRITIGFYFLKFRFSFRRSPEEENATSQEQTYEEKTLGKEEMNYLLGEIKKKKRSRNDVFLSTTLEIMQK